MNAPIHVGIDAGGTRTRVALVDSGGGLLGRGAAGVSLLGAGRERGGAALRAAFAEAGGGPYDIVGVGAGYAGVTTASTRAAVEELVRASFELGTGVRVLVDHDLGIAHRGAFAGAPGVTLVAGTGSAAFTYGPDGAEVRAGGRGPFVDDAGSAYDLGRAALRACVRALDGRAPTTSLVAACGRELGVGSEQELVAVIARGDFARARVAALAPRVFVEAREQDATARALLEAAASELAHAALTVARRACLPQPAVACVGGLFADPTFQDAVATALARSNARCVRPLVEPEVGAAQWSLSR